MTSFTTELATPSVTDVRMDILPHLMYKHFVLYISFDWWMCAFVVLCLVFPYQAKILAWGTYPKWPVLYRVGHKSTTQSINQFWNVLEFTSGQVNEFCWWSEKIKILCLTIVQLMSPDIIRECPVYRKLPLKVLIMAALRSRCGHYIFALWFLSSIFLFFLA